MSTHQTPPYAQIQPVNGLAIAGFICSLVGVVATAGLLCPIGLILSLVALSKPGGRGFAIAGVIIGGLGTCGGLVFILLIAFGILAIGLGVAAVALLANPNKVELTLDMGMTAAAIEEYRDENNYLPASLSDVSVDQARLTDPWGQTYRYVLDDELENGYDLISAGIDTEFGTDDDVRLSALGEMWRKDGAVRIETTDTGDGESVTITVGGRRIVDIRSDETGDKVTVSVGDETYEVEEEAGEETVREVDEAGGEDE